MLRAEFAPYVRSFSKDGLSRNPAAVPFLVLHPEWIDYYSLTRNPAPTAMHLLENNLDKVTRWDGLCGNPSAHAVEIVASYLREGDINWGILSSNPGAVALLARNVHLVHWPQVCANPAAISLIEERWVELVANFWCQEHLAANPAAMHLLQGSAVLARVPPELSSNPHDDAVRFLADNLPRVDWRLFSLNLAAAPILKQNLPLVNWSRAARVQTDLELLREAANRGCWRELCANPAAIELIVPRLEEFSRTPEWGEMARNLSANPAIFEAEFDVILK